MVVVAVAVVVGVVVVAIAVVVLMHKDGRIPCGHAVTTDSLVMLEMLPDHIGALLVVLVVVATFCSSSYHLFEVID